MSSAKAPAWRCPALLLLVFVLAGAGVAAVALPWLAQDRRYDREIERRAEQLGRLRGLAATLPELRRRLEALRKDKSMQAFYLPATDAALAGVDLQRRVKAIVEQVGGSLQSIQVLPVAPEGGMRRVAVRVRFRAMAGALGQALFRIEDGQPLLFVDRLAVRAPVVRRRKGRAPLRATPLNIDMDVHGYMRGKG